MRVEWLPLANEDRQHQILYLAERNPRAAGGIGDSIEEAAQQLETYPSIGRSGRVPGTRELVVPRTPFILVYRIEQDAVVIIRLLHGAQEWPSRRRR